ncbi:MAG: DUF2007 domain-containing protein [Gammaproteobacteria bacterium]|nr:DUF2007 domain-containing protein [Gammaproteobacteria bacterium]
MAKFETVASFMSPIEAHIAKERLESEEIPSFVAHANHVWANWSYANALGGVKIKVLEKNADNAKKYWINILMANMSPISKKCLQI